MKIRQPCCKIICRRILHPLLKARHSWMLGGEWHAILGSGRGRFMGHTRPSPSIVGGARVDRFASTSTTCQHAIRDITHQIQDYLYIAATNTHLWIGCSFGGIHVAVLPTYSKMTSILMRVGQICVSWTEFVLIVFTCQTTVGSRAVLVLPGVTTSQMES